MIDPGFDDIFQKDSDIEHTSQFKYSTETKIELINQAIQKLMRENKIPEII